MMRAAVQQSATANRRSVHNQEPHAQAARSPVACQRYARCRSAHIDAADRHGGGLQLELCLTLQRGSWRSAVLPQGSEGQRCCRFGGWLRVYDLYGAVLPLLQRMRNRWPRGLVIWGPVRCTNACKAQYLESRAMEAVAREQSIHTRHMALHRVADLVVMPCITRAHLEKGRGGAHNPPESKDMHKSCRAGGAGSGRSCPMLAQ